MIMEEVLPPPSPEKVMPLKKNEEGALIIEATIVFPIMFIILLFLLYMGNMFYMRSSVDAIVSMTATETAARCADPMLKKIEEKKSVPKTVNDIQPYHSLSGNSSVILTMRNQMIEKLNGLGSGFYSGMGLRNVKVNKFAYENELLYSTVTVDVSYQIQFPIRFLGDDQPVVLNIQSCSVVPVTDTPEFIQNMDMVIDYADSTGVSEKINQLVSGITKFLSD